MSMYTGQLLGLQDRQRQEQLDLHNRMAIEDRAARAAQLKLQNTRQAVIDADTAVSRGLQNQVMRGNLESRQALKAARAKAQQHMEAADYLESLSEDPNTDWEALGKTPEMAVSTAEKHRAKAAYLLDPEGYAKEVNAEKLATKKEVNAEKLATKKAGLQNKLTNIELAGVKGALKTHTDMKGIGVVEQNAVLDLMKQGASLGDAMEQLGIETEDITADLDAAKRKFAAASEALAKVQPQAVNSKAPWGKTKGLGTTTPDATALAGAKKRYDEAASVLSGLRKKNDDPYNLFWDDESKTVGPKRESDSPQDTVARDLMNRAAKRVRQSAQIGRGGIMERISEVLNLASQVRAANPQQPPAAEQPNTADSNANGVDDRDEMAMVWARENRATNPVKADAIMKHVKAKYPTIYGKE